ncbi:MAG: rhamnulokinase [Treponema sp.]|jgi:rhamnulokinase|nr:rhamnulokinase [Treponema sp.]
MRYYLAIDIGASSGRHILGSVSRGKMTIEEVYRFPNEMRQVHESLCWDTALLFRHILMGMKKCKEAGKIPYSVGIDTWGVDFVLTDREGSPIAPAAAYRDNRTEGMDREVERHISFEELYGITGIQKQPFNTIYQLMALKKRNPALLEKAERLLMIPDYFNFRLTGVESHEYTNATTTALVDAARRNWSGPLIERLGFPQRLFPPLSLPGTVLGTLTPHIREEIGYDCMVVLPATHDTGSAYLAVPAQGDDAVYLSSGTWSLIGIESPSPIMDAAARKANFTNEGGYTFRYRFLKNIIGLWIVQSIKRELGDAYSFAVLQKEAEACGTFPSLIDVNAPELLAPASMIDAVKNQCTAHGCAVPQTPGELMRCVYRSLARCYADAVHEIALITGKTYRGLHIVGGGSKDGFLNQLTAQASGIPVYAGPDECTVIGNLIAQMLAAHDFSDISSARKAVAESFPIKKYIVIIP